MAALRNMAIRAVRTTHFIVLDVDLWPSASLHDAAMAAPPALLRSKYTAFVVPAFELEPTEPTPPITRSMIQAIFVVSLFWGWPRVGTLMAACGHILDRVAALEDLQRRYLRRRYTCADVLIRHACKIHSNQHCELVSSEHATIDTRARSSEKYSNIAPPCIDGAFGTAVHTDRNRTTHNNNKSRAP